MAPSAAVRPVRIGLTGGIASGKSTVAALFAALGVAVIDADQIAREVVAPGTALLTQLFKQFGEQLRRADGSLDRALLRQQVFADATRRIELEALLHPAIQQRSNELSAQVPGPYQIHVSPLLTETGSRTRYDRVLLVDCPEELQIQRLRARDGCDLAQARAMLAAQASRAQRLAIADDVLLNIGENSALQAPVAALHQQYLAFAAARSE